jgi:phosphatidylinositol phospholipase C, delta
VVKNNGFNPLWDEKLSIPFECAGDDSMLDLCFVKFVVRLGGKGNGEPVAVYCSSLGSLEQG